VFDETAAESYCHGSAAAAGGELAAWLLFVVVMGRVWCFGQS
jgi:hypothetical protein